MVWVLIELDKELGFTDGDAGALERKKCTLEGIYFFADLGLLVNGLSF